MTAPKRGRPRKGERERLGALLYARAVFAAEQLAIAVSRGASRRVIEALVDQRVEAVQALAEHAGIVESDDFTFYQSPPSAA